MPLISDTEKSLAKKYNVLKQKSMFGKKYMGIERSTFIINKKGMIEKSFRKVKVDGHADEVLSFIKNEL